MNNIQLELLHIVQQFPAKRAIMINETVLRLPAYYSTGFGKNGRTFSLIFCDGVHKGISQLVPVLSPERKSFPTLMVRQVAEFIDLMNQKTQADSGQECPLKYRTVKAVSPEMHGNFPLDMMVSHCINCRIIRKMRLCSHSSGKILYAARSPHGRQGTPKT
jgi:hypothetical protein